MAITKIKTDTGQTKWEVRLHLAGRGSKRLRRRFDRRIDAEVFLAEETSKLRSAGTRGNATSYVDCATFASEAEYWLTNRGLTISPGHLKRAKGVLADLLPICGRWKPERFDARFITKFQSDQIAKGLKSATVNRKVEVIKAVLRFSFERRRIRQNPLFGFRKLEEVRDGTDFWSKDEAAKFLSFTDRKYPQGLPHRWVYAVYLVALNTAIRAGEIWGLQPQDLKGDGLILIERQYDRVSKSYRPPKGKKSRRVPCNAMLASELQQLVTGSTGPSIFYTRDGSPICHETFVRSFYDRDVKESGVHRIRFHDMRHTAATLMLASGVPLNTVKEICGHADIATTMGYVHLLADSVKDAGRTFSVAPAALPTSRPTLQIVG